MPRVHRAVVQAAAVAAFCGAGASLSHAEDWKRFLGSEGNSTSTEQEAPPIRWDDQTNVRWKAELPGDGVSSPIVVDDKVFVTSYSGYGTGGENEEMEDLKRHLTCYDAASGEQLWSKTVDAVLPEDPYRPPGVTAHGYASHTPASDGQRVFAFFGKTGIIAFDLQGNELWRQSVGTGSGPERWGSAASPIVYQSGDQTMVIVTASEESESMFAFDAATGKQAWKTEAGDFQGTWSTPTLVKADGRTDLVISVPGEVWGLNPESGKLRWYSRGVTDSTASASAVGVDGVVYAVGGRSGDAVAVRAGGKGDVNDSQVVWDAKIPGRFASPIVHQGHLYVFSGGVLSCYDAQSGDRVGQKRLDASRADGGAQADGGSPPGEDRGRRGGRGGGGGFGDRRSMEYATPVLAGGNLYVVHPGGDFFVVRATPEMELLATNHLTDPTGFSASPAVSQGRLYLRSGKTLYCVADSGE
ncbi:PQQ-binding-like beta-propeller repeat protein [Roseiconus nitratireducens]|uniref:PQQ-binding-like beta-propeller repeat protein n=1 Tax=Roseiconus nitratireducens TaxID=2605748 RepID=UPI00137557FB|nr:PQQ-binding-like beta-propeller repeat protein [Roseiconus nitratireducens]